MSKQKSSIDDSFCIDDLLDKVEEKYYKAKKKYDKESSKNNTNRKTNK